MLGCEQRMNVLLLPLDPCLRREDSVGRHPRESVVIPANAGTQHVQLRTTLECAAYSPGSLLTQGRHYWPSSPRKRRHPRESGDLALKPPSSPRKRGPSTPLSGSLLTQGRQYWSSSPRKRGPSTFSSSRRTPGPTSAGVTTSTPSQTTCHQRHLNQGRCSPHRSDGHPKHQRSRGRVDDYVQLLQDLLVRR